MHAFSLVIVEFNMGKGNSGFQSTKNYLQPLINSYSLSPYLM